jgi:hypothetical protein
MTTLVPFAQLLAMKPPVEVLKHIMDWYADETGYKAAATFWKDMVDKYTEEEATYSAGATCDLAAMCMMVVAAGVKRVEAMKDQLRKVKKDKPKGLVFEDKKYGDRVYFYKSQDDADNFEKLLTEWGKLQGSGVVQFKFKVKGDWHTFALERAQEKKDEPKFYVYQAYQNVYRLADFLGEGSTAAQEKHMKVVWKELSAGDKKAHKDDEEGFIKDNLERIDQTVRHLGCKTALDMATLKAYVIDPLSTLLKGGLRGKDYVLMTASHAKDRFLSTDFMAVLMCDTVSPDQFKQNYEDLRATQGLTMYPECE